MHSTQARSEFPLGPFFSSGKAYFLKNKAEPRTLKNMSIPSYQQYHSFNRNKKRNKIINESTIAIGKSLLRGMARILFGIVGGIWFVVKYLYNAFRRAPTSFWRGVVWVILFFGVGCVAIVGIMILYYSSSLPQPGKLLERTVPQSTKIYDRTGDVLLYDVHGDEKRTAVKLADISPYAKWAAIVAEDRDFYQHKGFKFTSLMRAALVDIIHGEKKQGGSTITQQFVKNAVLTRDKAFTRKLKELILAYEIERKFSKDQILEMYFNEIPYGSTSYGVEAASQTFLGKSSQDLTIVDGALLAAMANAPTYYSPYGNHRDQLVARTRMIIRSMGEMGYIPAQDTEKALVMDPLAAVVPPRTNITAPHFVMYVKDLLAEKYGEEVIEQGGYKVITTLDAEMQKIGEEEVKKGAERNQKQYGAANAALVALEAKTGQILTMVGSRDYFADSLPAGCVAGVSCTLDPQVNVVLSQRQPGSSFKPVVYSAAFAKGYTPETVLYDVVTTFKTDAKDYAPRNYDGREYGPLTMRRALAGSLNIPAVKTLYLAGVGRVLDQAEKMGYSTFADRSRFGLSLVLGGGEVKLLEHANAFGVFARDGEYVPTAAILKVEDVDGNVLEEWQQPDGDRVIDAQVARQVVDVMSDNAARAYIFGANSPLILKDRVVAAKTGTTNDWHDGWTMGYTPSIVAGVWVGNNNNAAMKRNADGSFVAAPIWNAFMTRAHAGKPVESFIEPEIAGAEKPILRGEVTGIHTILYYVDKDDPRGPYPQNPWEDPQFASWEAGVKNWAIRNNLPYAEPGSANDVPVTPPTGGSMPSDSTVQTSFPVLVTSPVPGGVVSGTTIVAFTANPSQPIAQVEALVDGALKSSAQGNITSFPVAFDGLSVGTHTLTLNVFDDAGNLGTASVQFEVR